MNFLASLSSAVINAGSAALAGGNGVPGLPAYTLGERVNSYQGKSIWTLYEGVKKVRACRDHLS
jgi:SCY1-like protein 1